MIPLPDILTLAKLCSASYAAGDQAAEALGLTNIERVGDDACLALVGQMGERDVVVLRGTDLGAVTDLAEIWSDLDGGCIKVGAGVAHAGFWRPLVPVWAALLPLLRRDAPVVIAGHSLGGVRAHLAAALARGRQAQVVSFGAPKGATLSFWLPAVPITRVVHARDFAPTWPWLRGEHWVHPPGQFLWLDDGRAELVDQRGSLNLSGADHAIEGYVAAIEGVVAGQAALV